MTADILDGEIYCTDCEIPMVYGGKLKDKLYEWKCNQCGYVIEVYLSG